MTDTFTPGPWAVRPHWSDDSMREVYPTRPGKELQFGAWSDIAEVREGGEGESAEANARLIAAAPDLLEQLVFARRMMVLQMGLFGNDVEASPLIADIDRVIASATGADAP